MSEGKRVSGDGVCGDQVKTGNAVLVVPQLSLPTRMHSGKSADALTSVSRIRPKLWRKWGSLRGAPGSARPTGGMQIHRRLAISLPQLRWSGHGLDAEPYKTKRPLPFPPPAGEGVAHKGDRRGRTWRDRDVEMNATVGMCERLYRLLAVRFSLFRHPPRGGTADATFPRWGKEGETRSGPVGGGGFLFVLSAKCSRVSQREHPCREAAHERHEEKDKCTYSEDTCPFLLIHRPRRHSCQTLPAA